jgi:hypothetical protein
MLVKSGAETPDRVEVVWPEVKAEVGEAIESPVAAPTRRLLLLTTSKAIFEAVA